MNIMIGLTKGAFPIHMHQCYEIVIYTKGSGVFYAKNRQIPFSPGTIIIIPPLTLHTSSSEEEYERIYINGEFNQILSFTSPVVLSDNTEKEGVFLAKMIYRNRFENSEYITSLVNAFTHYILRSIETDDEINVAIRNIINKITDQFFDSDISLSTLLKESGYAEDYIRAEFKKLTGKTPIRFLTEIRIEHACFLIDAYKKSITLTEVSEKCGYTDYVYFSRQFKKVKGVSPREYISS